MSETSHPCNRRGSEPLRYARTHYLDLAVRIHRGTQHVPARAHTRTYPWAALERGVLIQLVHGLGGLLRRVQSPKLYPKVSPNHRAFRCPTAVATNTIAAGTIASPANTSSTHVQTRTTKNVTRHTMHYCAATSTNTHPLLPLPFVASVTSWCRSSSPAGPGMRRRFGRLRE